ncbi:MAG TPA: hypothetical protein VMT52_14350 [Planctomycetota bacterium]|nr:hypothetical protein [Planctomycetota bacterium]
MLERRGSGGGKAAGVVFDLAGPPDDAGLRGLLRESPMRGRMDVAFLREPSYFRAASIAGTFVQTIIARAPGGVIAGAGTRATRPAFLNGEVIEAGCLGDLRLRGEFRGRTILARGYRFLRGLHEDGRTQVYSTVIVEGNRLALETIAANRADLPRYTDLGRVVIPMIHLPIRGRRIREAGDRIERGSPALLPRIVERLNENRLQFAPVYRVEDFSDGKRFPGFRVEDFRVLWRGGRMEAVIGIWDQRSFRRTVVLGYHGVLRAVRPLSRLLGPRALPAPGKAIDFIYLAFAAADDVPAFRALLEHACGDALKEDAGIRYATLGLHERDPRLPALLEHRHTPFAGRLFAVTFDGPPGLDGRVPYVEAALL